MTTETTSLDTMLDALEPGVAAEPSHSPAPETGDKDSTAPPADATAQDSSSDGSPHVPRRALEDERRKRQDLERRLQSLEKAAAPREEQSQPQQHQITQEELERLWWENPAQAAAIVQHYAAQNAAVHAERMMLSRELDRSERRARKVHGENVTAALQQARAVGKIGEFLEEDDPYQSLMDWYGEIEPLRDPQSAREKMRAELMAEMGMAPAAPKPAAQAPVPKSLASRTSAQPRNTATGQFERASLDDLLG